MKSPDIALLLEADQPKTHGARTQAKRRTSWVNAGWVVVIAAVCLSVFGIAAIDTTQPDSATRQLAHVVVGLVFGCLVAVPDYRRFRKWTWPLAILAALLLIVVLIPWMPEWIVRPRNGARRWINFGISDLQPSELAKIAWIALMAEWLVRRRSHRRAVGFLLSFAVTIVPFVLILVEPDLGTAMLFIPTLLVMLLVAGARWRHLLVVVLLGAAIGPLAYFTPGALKPHQVARVDAILAQMRGDKSLDRDEGFQAARARIVAGAGGITGVGAEHARAIVTFNRLPEERNDMIFAVVVCRWGLLGGLVMIGLYVLLGVGGLLTAATSRDAFGRLLVVGVVSMVFFQMLINMGMTIGLLPITGMTLPLVSYGGSSVLATWVMVGIVLNVALRRSRPSRSESRAFESFED